MKKYKDRSNKLGCVKILYNVHKINLYGDQKQAKSKNNYLMNGYNNITSQPFAVFNKHVTF